MFCFQDDWLLLGLRQKACQLKTKALWAFSPDGLVPQVQAESGHACETWTIRHPGLQTD